MSVASDAWWEHASVCECGCRVQAKAIEEVVDEASYACVLVVNGGAAQESCLRNATSRGPKPATVCVWAASGDD